MVTKLWIYYHLYLCTRFLCVNGFIPHPLVAEGSQSDDSITHVDITELAFIRSLARYFYDTRFAPTSPAPISINLDDYLTKQHTIDSLYKLAFPEYNAVQLAFYSLPLKFTLDFIMTQNALVDFEPQTKILSAAHFDSEAFINGSRRILRLRGSVVADALTPHADLTHARAKLGQLLHTLQDFYSHSNWVEMGKTDINDLIGRNETIGLVAAPTQATCSDTGCTKKTLKCSFWQMITLRKCPLVYYDCSDNILSQINSQQLLTSGYLFNQLSETGDLVSKSTVIRKCSHGSVLDDSAQIPAVGGINKDSNNLLFSPHSNLHFKAVDFAVHATQRFLNDLRKDIGDGNFDRLFRINPSDDQAQTATNAMADGRRFRFFTSLLSASLQKSDSLYTDLKNVLNTLKLLWNSIWTSQSDTPTRSLSDQGVNTKDPDNVHTAPYLISTKHLWRKRHLIDALRRRRSSAS